MADPASVNVERTSLSSLPYDILYQISAYLASSSTKSRYIRKPWSSLSQTCRYLRDATLPEMFKSLAVSGSWSVAMDRLEDLQKHPNLLIYVRFVAQLFLCPQSWGRFGSVFLSFVSS